MRYPKGVELLKLVESFGIHASHTESLGDFRYNSSAVFIGICDGLFDSCQSRFVVWLFCDFAAVIDVSQFAIGVDDEDRSCVATAQWATLDEYAVVFAELSTTV